MCPDCGFYKGRMVIDMQAKKEAREARLKAKEEMRKAQQGFGEEEQAGETPTEEATATESQAESAETEQKKG
jgi:hypothetical protein